MLKLGYMPYLAYVVYKCVHVRVHVYVCVCVNTWTIYLFSTKRKYILPPKITVLQDVTVFSLVDRTNDLEEIAASIFMIELFYLEDGGSTVLWNVGTYLHQTTWCHIPEDRNPIVSVMWTSNGSS
jgi:hypothetical protein